MGERAHVAVHRRQDRVVLGALPGAALRIAGEYCNQNGRDRTRRHRDATARTRAGRGQDPFLPQFALKIVQLGVSEPENGRRQSVEFSGIHLGLSIIVGALLHEGCDVRNN